MAPRSDSQEPRVRVVASLELTPDDRERMARLFDATYRDANHAYLDKSCKTLRYVAFAETGDTLVGFSFGDSVRAALPRMDGPQSIALAGIACIDETVRRRGLFIALSVEAVRAGGGIDPDRRFLFCGRMAHVITYRTMANASDTVVPAVGRTPSAWHGEVAREVAALYGVEVDPVTFVVRGSGVPVGFPRLQYEASQEELQLFARVDRRRGDSLLSMCWMPDAPAGW